jgi:hypothetical protein
MLPLQHQFVRDGHSSLFPSSQIKLSSSRRTPGPMTTGVYCLQKVAT